jgi:uncharacterized membrane protein YebE (DUF533 family)
MPHKSLHHTQNNYKNKSLNMSILKDLKAVIIADGKIDADEVSQIKKIIYEDGSIDTAEADFLFDLNDNCHGADNHASWSTLFVDAICSYLLEDEKSPGVIDKKEAEWLLGKIQGDGKLDANEKKLLKKLASNAKSMPDNLKQYIEKN